MRVCREFFFDASHYLPGYKGKCENIHGHTYRLVVCIKGAVGAEGMVMDFNELKAVVSKHIIERLDHQNLNGIIENPTAENIACWIFKELEGHIPVCGLKLWEGNGKWVELDADDLG